MRMPTMLRRALLRSVAKLLFVVAAGAASTAYAGKPYQQYVLGDPADVVRPAPAAPSLVLMGGEFDVDEAFKWMIDKSGGGNFVVIRATNVDNYNAKIFALGGDKLASVETLVIPSRAAANDPFVIARIRGAEALFIAGGDQSDYVNYWQDTPVQDAIQELAGRNAPIGGTSAGLAVMGQYIFTALKGGITSSDALANPFDKSIVLGRDFFALPFMGGLITDSHFASRDRMGRLITFMARIVDSGWTSDGTVRGIGLDPGTALLVDDGNATLKRAPSTSGSAYFLRTTGTNQIYSKIPLTYPNIDVQRLSASDRTFDLRRWTSIYTFSYSVSAVNGALYSTSGSIY